MKLRIRHGLTYSYKTPAKMSIQLVRLVPSADHRQKVLWWNFKAPSELTAARDGFGNDTQTLCIHHPQKTIEIIAQGEVETLDVPYAYPLDEMDSVVYLKQTRFTRPEGEFLTWCQGLKNQFQDLLQQEDFDLLFAELNQVMTVQKGVTSVETSGQEAFANGGGVSQDLTHVLLGTLRFLEIPCRYVSGYVFAERGQELVNQAWVELKVGKQWLGYDAFHARWADARHIRLAVGMDIETAGPIRGAQIGGDGEKLSAMVKVKEILEAGLPPTRGV